MFPRLFTIGSFSLPTYGFLLACAYVCAILWLRARAPQRGLTPDQATDLGISILIASLVGSKLVLFLLSPTEFLSLSGLVSLLRAGGVFYGGLIAASATGLYLLRRDGLPMWDVADLAAPAIALGESIGRVGCLAAGCCWGRPTGVSWAITFSDPYTHQTIGTPLGIPLHPTQVYLSLDALFLFLVLTRIDRHRRFPGQVFWTYILLHSVLRAIVEIYRGDVVRGFLIPDLVSTSQAIAAAAVAASLVMMAILSRRTRPASP